VRGSHDPQDVLGYCGDMRVEEDTIELMLSPEEIAVLSQAAAENTDAAEPVAASEQPAQATKPPRRHWPAGGVAAIVGVTVVLGTLVALGAIAQRSAEHKHLAVAPPAPPPVIAPTVAQQPPPPPGGEPVRFKNPFDHSEVFEFPPGTSQAEMRQAVAELLMERARDRHVQLVERKRSTVRRASGNSAVSPDLAQNSVRMPR
jgi:hypothetical protein